jgi:hypothetical protein
MEMLKQIKSYIAFFEVQHGHGQNVMPFKSHTTREKVNLGKAFTIRFKIFIFMFPTYKPKD